MSEAYDIKAGKSILSSMIEKEKTLNNPYPCYGGNGLRGYVSEYNQQGDKILIGRQKILRGESIGAIRAATVPTEEALRSSGDIELKEKFDAWNGKFNEKSEDGSYKIKDVAELAKDDALKEMEDKLVQECHYLMLCEDVRLQEEFIQKRIERYWDGQRLTRLLKRMLNYRALAVLSGSVLIAMSFLGIISLDEAVPTLQKLGFVIAPVIVDVVVNLFGVHKPDQKG